MDGFMMKDGICCERLAVTLFYGRKLCPRMRLYPSRRKDVWLQPKRSRNQENGPYDGMVVAAGGLQGWKRSLNRLYNPVVFHVWGSAGWRLYDGKVCKTYLDGGRFIKRIGRESIYQVII